MKLNRLKIGKDDNTRGYKNFKNTLINFSENSNYSVFIGINGSGKSNLLEVVSKIFRSLYLISSIQERVDFDFELDYDIRLDEDIHEVKIKFIDNRFSFISNINGRINQDQYINYLPKQIIANYSGEELRLWNEVYFKFYKDYTDEIRDLQDIENMKMIYLNKYNWDIALICLLCLEDSKILELLNLSIEDINGVNVKFKFDYSKYDTYNENNVIKLIDEINNEKNEEYTVPLLTMKLTETVQDSSVSLIQKYLNLFNYLYVASMPETNKIITDMSVEFIDFNTQKLSEGEKKMILIYFINYLSKDKESLILFDEPDSHVHISRKKDLVENIKNSEQYSLVTTHSPVMVNHFDEKSINLLSPTENDGVKSEQAEKYKQVELLTDESISLLDTSLIISTTKNILMCEGVNDIRYIRKALEVLNRNYNNKYKALNDIIMINCGGADNVPSVYEEIVHENLSTGQICVCIFDYDRQGMINKKKIEQLSVGQTNVKALYHPSSDVDIDQNEDPTDKNTFLMENYFSVSSYKDIIISSFQNSNTLKDLSQFQNPKSIIQKKYESFDDSNFHNFDTLFDKLLDEFDF